MLNGESGILAEEWHFDLDTPYIPALQLPHAVIKHICQYLPTQGDKQRACLIHPLWLPAAIDSLWEEPLFHTAAAFQGFYKIVHIKKNLALRVQSLNIIHDPNNSDTNTIKRSSQPHHALKESTLAKPAVIMALVRLCENIKSLQIYGWQIQAQHIENLSHMLPELQHLTIIGDNERLMVISSAFRNLLSRLSTLRLDGVHNIDASFIDLLYRRCQNLESLQLSVQDIGPDGFETLTYGKLRLRELVLTDCVPLKDFHVAEIVRAFPHLRTLILDGANKLTGESLAHIFERCHELEKLDIRVEPDCTKQAQSQTANQHLKLYGKAGDLRQLSLRGICLDAITVQSSLCGHPQLRELTLEACDVLCDDDFRLICKSSPYLESIRLIDCSNLTGRALKSIARTNDAKLINVSMIRCGLVSPQQLKQFCQSVADRSSKKLVVSQGKGLTHSEYVTYASVDPSTQEPTYIFDRDAIDLLAQANHSYDSLDDSEHLISQRTYTLDRKQVAMVAELLGIPSQQLRGAISKVLSTAPKKKAPKFANDAAKPSPQHTSQVPCPPTFAASERESTPVASRISFKANEYNGFESTNEPATSSMTHMHDWSIPSENRKNSLGNRKISIKPAEAISAPLVSPAEKSWKEPVPVSTPPLPQSQLPDFNVSPKEQNEQKIVFKYQPLRDQSKPISKELPPTASPSPPPRKEDKPTTNGGSDSPTDMMELGGWGAASSPNWGDGPSFSETSNGWDATAVDRMTWQPAQVINAPVAKGPKKKGTRLFLPANSSAEGWGAPPTQAVPWDDNRRQGFAHDIIESQHQTVFWKLENGVWKKLSSGEQQQSSEAQGSVPVQQRPRMSTAGLESPSLFTPLTRYVHGNSASVVEKDRPAVDMKQEVNEYQFSDDDDVANSSNSDDGVTIRTSSDDPYVRPKDEPTSKTQYKNIMDEDLQMDFSKTMLATQQSSGEIASPPSHPGNPQWVSFEEWRKDKLASSIDHPDSTSQSHIMVEQGGWDEEHAEQVSEANTSQNWSAMYDDVPQSAVTAPVASYKLVDILDNFNETMSMQSAHSREMSETKWGGYDSNIGLYQSANENDNLPQDSPNKHEATVEYIKAQAESRHTARYDVIRQTETDLISNTGSYGQYELDESKYISNTNWEGLEFNRNADDDWVSSSTSEAGYPVSGLGISTRGRGRGRGKPRSSVRHPMRREQMAGQWGSFPIDNVSLDDVTGEPPSVQSLINVDMDETFANDQTLNQEHKPMPHLTSSFPSSESPEPGNAFSFNADSTFATSDVERANSMASDVNAYMNKENEHTPLDEFEATSNFDMPTTSAADDWITNSTNGLPKENKYTSSANNNNNSNLFDDLMDEESNELPSNINTSSADTTIATAPQEHQEVSPQTASPMQNSTDSLRVSNSKSVVLSVQIETVGSGTQPLVITESDDPKVAIHEFCDKWAMTEYEDRIMNVTLPRYKEKMAKRVLGRMSKTSSGTLKSTPSPSTATASVEYSV
ncbi:hypothetical protein INT44_002277 [Umbelopsis vinacea]|uniref:Uncharacterized protein n=1 Tax=Umbelopsis vinacea TaxID=44442 RepID=A0A8H7Q469_9FUNG|nr:hypothetical protein INT44_002277 [Umbelopsis vinacea]